MTATGMIPNACIYCPRRVAIHRKVDGNGKPMFGTLVYGLCRLHKRLSKAKTDSDALNPKEMTNETR